MQLADLLDKRRLLDLAVAGVLVLFASDE